MNEIIQGAEQKEIANLAQVEKERSGVLEWRINHCLIYDNLREHSHSDTVYCRGPNLKSSHFSMNLKNVNCVSVYRWKNNFTILYHLNVNTHIVL